MPYIVKQDVIGGRSKVEYLPPDPHEISIGYRQDKREGENLRIGIMRDQELAQSAAIGVEQRLVPEEAIIDVKDVAEMREEQVKLWGKDCAEHYQHFGKPAFRR